MFPSVFSKMSITSVLNITQESKIAKAAFFMLIFAASGKQNLLDIENMSSKR
jgi:hypothetical protein